MDQKAEFKTERIKIIVRLCFSILGFHEYFYGMTGKANQDAIIYSHYNLDF